MARVDYIALSAAPPMPSKNKASAKAEFSRGVVRNLSEGFAAELTPEYDESTRGLRVSLAHAARDTDIKIKTWEFDGRVYVRLI
jgi:hypothetical protein